MEIPIWSNQIAEIVQRKCASLYEKKGLQSVIDYADSLSAGYAYCRPCQADQPVVKTESSCSCLVCGGTVKQ